MSNRRRQNALIFPSPNWCTMYNDCLLTMAELDFKGVFIWRRTSPLGWGSSSKRAEFHLVFTWEFSGPSSRAGILDACVIGGPALLNVFTWITSVLLGEIPGSQ